VEALADGCFTASTGVRIDTAGVSNEACVTSNADQVRWIVQGGVILKKDSGGDSTLSVTEILDAPLGDVDSGEIYARAECVRSGCCHGLDTTILAGEAVMTNLLKGPYLQWLTTDAMTVMWETADDQIGEVEWFEAEAVHAGLSGAAQTVEGSRRSVCEVTAARIHRVRLDGLESGREYHYRVVGEETLHPLHSAPEEATPFSFCVTSETGGYGDDKINEGIFEQIARYRPDVLVVVGDAVSRGNNYDDWARFFFGPAKSLLHSTPFYLCPGNHEENADWFYRFTDFPEPENYYGFDYGHAHFTAADTTRLVDYVDGCPQETSEMAPTSAQRTFLRDDLNRGASSIWQFAFYHYPPYVSGDFEVPQMRALGADVDAAKVDVVFNSHTIVYERSHPIRQGQLDVEEGTIYIVAGGAGAKPDWFHPKRAWHTAQAQAVPHFVHVAIAGPTLELQAVDVDGRVFDQLRLTK